MQICTLLDVNTYVTNFYTYKKNLDLNQFVSTNHGPCSTTAFITEKNLHISGPVQLKPAFFKGHLYFIFF